MTGDPLKFAGEIEEMARDVEKKAVSYVRQQVSGVYKRVVRYSPVYTGSFMRSHRISFDVPDLSFTLLEPKLDQHGNPMRAPRGPAVSAALKRLWIVDTWTLDHGPDLIHISNSVPHAFSVEFGNVIHNVPAYAPYAKAKADFMAGIT